MSFELFGPETKCDIKVGYISTDRGLVEGIGLYEANQHAKLNPGTQFIFRNRDKVNYLNINEVNNIDNCLVRFIRYYTTMPISSSRFIWYLVSSSIFVTNKAKNGWG